LNTLFKKLGVASRARLIAMAQNSQLSDVSTNQAPVDMDLK
jgi:hypothetical protein